MLLLSGVACVVINRSWFNQIENYKTDSTTIKTVVSFLGQIRVVETVFYFTMQYFYISNKLKCKKQHTNTSLYNRPQLSD